MIFPLFPIDKSLCRCYNEATFSYFTSRSFPMNTFDTFFFVLELISVISFGISGTMAAIRKGLDAFGVIFIAVTTAIGGGIIRDLVLGIHPPKSFANPIYALIVTVFALITFLVEYHHAKKHTKSPGPLSTRITDAVMFWSDTTGLAIFSMLGVAAAYELSDTYNAFLLCFVGTITGVGGGLLRDVMLNNMPYIFVKHFYASACIIGTVVCVSLWDVAGRVIAMIAGALTVMVLRYLAARFRWNLPHVPMGEEKTE